MKRVLVTGASGFIGPSAVASVVARGFEVHAVDQHPSASDADVQRHACDLHDLEAVRTLVGRVRPSHLLHLAWFVEGGAFWISPENLRWVGTTLGLLRTFAEAGGQHAVMAGTCAEYEPSDNPLGEDSALEPNTLYAASKDAVRRVAKAYCQGAGLQFAWGRIFFPYGPRQPEDRLVPSTIRALLGGQVARCSPGDQRRDFVHVDDVGDAFAAIVESDLEGPVNIASGEGARVRDVVTRIGELIGRPELIQLGAIPMQPGEPPAILADVHRLGSETRWRRQHTLETGLHDTIEWWRARNRRPAPSARAPVH